jgi:hypothetical protein
MNLECKKHSYRQHREPCGWSPRNPELMSTCARRKTCSNRLYEKEELPAGTYSVSTVKEGNFVIGE